MQSINGLLKMRTSPSQEIVSYIEFDGQLIPLMMMNPQAKADLANTQVEVHTVAFGQAKQHETGIIFECSRLQQ